MESKNKGEENLRHKRGKKPNKMQLITRNNLEPFPPGNTLIISMS